MHAKPVLVGRREGIPAVSHLDQTAQDVFAEAAADPVEGKPHLSRHVVGSDESPEGQEGRGPERRHRRGRPEPMLGIPGGQTFSRIEAQRPEDRKV